MAPHLALFPAGQLDLRIGRGYLSSPTITATVKPPIRATDGTYVWDVTGLVTR